MRILLTAGPTREPIDDVRYIGNRSSGKMGAAIVEAALAARHQVTLIAGPICVAMQSGARRIDVETCAQMREAVLAEWSDHDLLIMAAAVSDYRPKAAIAGKLPRQGNLLLELEATPDILAEAARAKSSHQRIIGFSLEVGSDLERAQAKLARKQADLLVHNPANTMDSSDVQASLLWPDGRVEKLQPMSKSDFARILIDHAGAWF